MDREQVDRILTDALNVLGVDAFTFYVKDPTWNDNLLLLSSPGVRIKEAVYGVSHADTFSAARLAAGTTELFLKDAKDDRLRRGVCPMAQQLIQQNAERNYVFGDFVVREEIASRVWLLNWCDDRIGAALTANYRKPKVWSEEDKTGLRSLFQEELVPHLAEIDWSLRSELGTSIVDFVAHSWQMAKFPIDEPAKSLDAILKAACGAFGITPREGCATIHLLEADNETLRLAAHFGDVDANVTERHLIRQGRGVIAWVALRRQPVLINNLPHSAFGKNKIYVACSNGCMSELAVPIIDDGKLIGVLNLESRHPDAFSWNGVAFLANTAVHAAHSFRLASHAERASRNEKLAKKMLHVSKLAASHTVEGKTERRLEDLARIACDYLRAEDCDIWRCFGGSFVCEGDTAASQYAGPLPWNEYIVEQKKPVWISGINSYSLRVRIFDDDAETWKDVTKGYPKKFGGMPIETEAKLGIPILLGNTCLGVTWIKLRQRDLTPSYMHGLLEACLGFAGQAAFVLSLLGEQDESRRDANRLLANLSEVCLEIVYGIDTDKVLKFMTQWLVDELPCQQCTIYLRDEADPKLMEPKASCGFPEAQKPHRAYKVGDGIVGHIAKHGEPLILDDPPAIQRFVAKHKNLRAEFAENCDSFFGSAIVVPNEGAVGTLLLTKSHGSTERNGRPFSMYHQQVVQTLCGVLAIRIRKEEVERDMWREENIAGFFHTFRSPVMTMTFTLDRLRELMKDDRLAKDLTLVYTDAMRVQQLVNNSAFWTQQRTRPSMEDVDIETLVQTVIARFREYLKFKKSREIKYQCSWQVGSVSTNASLYETVLCNLLQNAVEYGGDLVGVEIEATSSDCIMRVIDNGVGMSDDDLEKATRAYYRGSRSAGTDGLGLGLSVCKKAVGLLDGTMNFSNREPNGLLVEVTIPLSRKGAQHVVHSAS